MYLNIYLYLFHCMRGRLQRVSNRINMMGHPVHSAIGFALRKLGTNQKSQTELKQCTSNKRHNISIIIAVQIMQSNIVQLSYLHKKGLLNHFK